MTFSINSVNTKGNFNKKELLKRLSLWLKSMSNQSEFKTQKTNTYKENGQETTFQSIAQILISPIAISLNYFYSKKEL